MNKRLRSTLLWSATTLMLAMTIYWLTNNGTMPRVDYVLSESPPNSTSDSSLVAPESSPSHRGLPALVKSLPLQPPVARGGSVKVVPAAPEAPQAVRDFRGWASRYFLAQPEQREAMIPEGVRLAEAHRRVLKQLIPTQPKTALENAVPMVVRQDLPKEVVEKLEKRVNAQGQFIVAGVVPADGAADDSVVPVQRTFLPSSAAQVAQKTEEFRVAGRSYDENGRMARYNAFVYGRRESQRSLDSASLNGVAVDGLMAVNDSPVRVLEVGERPDPSKAVISTCPISGEESPVEPNDDGAVPPVMTGVTAVETDKVVRYFCASGGEGHVARFVDAEMAKEISSHWESLGVAAEGGTGGSLNPFSPPPGWTTGTSSILYIRCAFPEQGNDPQSEAECYDNLKRCTDYFMDNSRGRFYLVPTVAPLVILPYPEAWYNASRDGNNQPDGDFVIYDHARELARRMGFDTNGYDLDVVRWDRGPGSYGGLGSVGGKLVILKTNSLGVLAHEIGHNLGLMHSNYWRTTPPTSIGPGNNAEYGNKFDVMGSSGSLGHYVAPHKAIISWLTVDQYHDVRSTGIYRIYQTDHAHADAGKRYALRLPRDSERNYWLEFRQQFALPALTGGLMLTWDGWGHSVDNTAFGSNIGAQLIDTTPGSGTVDDTRDDAAIPVGKTFSDIELDTHMTPIVKSSTSPPYIDVQINRGPFPGNRAPTLSIIASAPTAGLNAPINFTATGSDPDGDALSYYWDFGNGTFSTDGLRTQSKSWATDGDYRVLCTATDRKGKTTTRGVTVTVGSGGNGFTVSGVIRDSSGNPLEGIYVSNRALINQIAQPNVNSFRYAFTDSAGVYVLTNIPETNPGATPPVPALQIYPNEPPYTFAPDFPNPFSVSADATGKDFQRSATAAGNLFTVAITDGAAGEVGANTATITLTRSNTSGTLDVPFMSGSNGTAVRNVDYTLSPAPAVVANTGGGLRYQFANGQATITIILTAVNDTAAEGEEYAVLEFPDAVQNYSRVGPTTISIPILDNDTANPVVTLVQSEPSSSEAGDVATMILRRNGPTTNSIVVNLNYSGVAALNQDVLSPTTVTIPSGASSANFTITAVDDIYAEGTEFGTVALATSANYERDTQQRQAQFYVTDNDQTVLSIAASDPSAAEAGTNPGKFTISRTANDLSQPITVQFSVGGTAQIGKDFRRIEGSAVIPAHELSVDIEIIPYDDKIDEAAQTVICRLATDDFYAIKQPAEATVTIADNDTTEYTIRALANRIVEPNAPAPPTHTRNLFEVTRPEPGPAVSIPITFGGSIPGLPTASAADYNNAPTTVDFDATATAVTVAFEIVNDAAEEDVEILKATLNPGPGYRLTRDSSAYVGIVDADNSTLVSLSYADGSFNLASPMENSGTFQFVVGRTGSTGADLLVPFTLSGTAVSPDDYTVSPASPLTIPSGQAAARITITLINDSIPEGTETITASLDSSTAYGRATRTATVNIRDNDAYTVGSPPSVQFNTTTSSVNERTGSSGSTHPIRVDASGTRTSNVSVDYYVSGGTANGNGVDYNLTEGTLTFAPTDTFKEIDLNTVLDGFPEGNETVIIRLTTNIGTNIGTNATHTVTITDLATPEALTDTLNNLPGTTGNLRGRAIANGLATEAWFEWRKSTTATWTSTPKQNIGTGNTLVTLGQQTITGLVYPGTYYYRTVAENAHGIVRGITRTIRTAAPPIATTLPTDSHNSTSATLLGSVNPNRLNAEVWFEWGTSPGSLTNLTPRQAVVASTTTVNVSAPVTGLVEGTLYFYRLNVLTSLGSAQGSIQSVAAVPQVIAGNLLVNLSARHPSAGTASWTNQGLLGHFNRSGTALVDPNVMGSGVPGVRFDGSSTRYTGPLADLDISGDSDRTIEVWVLNPGLASPDPIVNWGRDANGQQLALLYNNNPTAGALKHGGTVGNAGYGAAFPPLGQWQHLVYTYKAGKATLYVNGTLRASITTGTLNTSTDTILLGSLADATGAALAPSFHGYINFLRIHGGQLAAADVKKNFLLGPNVPPVSAPIVQTIGASAVTSTSGTMNARVVPAGVPTTAWIEWGTSTNYDNATPPQPAGSGWTPLTIALPASPLAFGVEYHFRVVAQNSLGVTHGDDVVFTPSTFANRGIVWVDLRASDNVSGGGADWHNRGALGDFAAVGTPTVSGNVSGTGLRGVGVGAPGDAYESHADAVADFIFDGDRTIEVWFFDSTGTTAETLIHLGRDAGPETSLAVSSPFRLDWHHLAIVRTGATETTYLDGIQTGSRALSGGSNILEDPILLAARRDSTGAINFSLEKFDGHFNTVRIHGGALTPVEVQSNFLLGPDFAGGSPVSPTVTTSGVNLVTATNATLTGLVNPGGAAATVWFEYGTSAALGSMTAGVNVPDSYSLFNAAAAIGGLTSGTTYHYRAVAQQGSNPPVEGSILTFVATGSIAGLPHTVATPATGILAGKATLNGTVSNGGLATQYWFEYGPSTNLGLTTTRMNLGAATATKGVAIPISALLPHANYYFRLVAENATGQVSSAVLTFTTPNAPPVATAGTAKTAEDSPVALTLKASDPDKEPLSLVITTPPANGVITGTSLSPVYSPLLNFNGTDTFAFSVTDGVATSAPAAFAITVTPVEDVPQGNASLIVITEDSFYSGNLLASDPEGDPITGYAIVQHPLSGVVSGFDSMTGSFTYTPDPDFFGTDSFYFTASSADGVSSPISVSFTVTGSPDSPVASSDSFYVEEDGLLLAQLRGYDPDGSLVTFEDLSMPAHGNLNVNTDGSFDFEPDIGYVGTDSFQFRVNDGTANSTVATATIVIGGPTAISADFSGVRNDIISGNLTGSDPNDSPLTFTLAEPPEHGSVSITTGTGAFRYDPDPDFVGADHFSFTVSNGTLSSGAAKVTLMVADNPPDWKWLAGANKPKQIGTLTGPTPYPGARGDASLWTDPVSGDAFLFGGLGLASSPQAGPLNDLWRRDHDDGTWSLVQPAPVVNGRGNYGAQSVPALTNRPGARSSALSWTTPDGKFWLFGGIGRDSTEKGFGPLNDLWVYDSNVGLWTWKKGAALARVPGTYGPRLVPNSTSTPGARSGGSGWVDCNGDLWLFGGNGLGGSGSTIGDLNDLWRYQPSTNRWTWIGGSTSVNALGVYGVMGVTSATAYPSARVSSTAWYHPSGKAYLFGGLGRGSSGNTRRALGDLWVFDPLANTWTWLNGSSTSATAPIYGTRGLPSNANSPGARSGAAGWHNTADHHSSDGCLYLFGGQGSTYYSDLWRYQPLTGQWTWLKGPTKPNSPGTYGSLGLPAPGNTPGARRGSSAFATADGSLFLFGGVNGSNSFNDLWHIRIMPEQHVFFARPVAFNVSDTSLDVSVDVYPNGPATEVFFTVHEAANPLIEFSSTPQNLAAFNGVVHVTDFFDFLDPGTTYVLQAHSGAHLSLPVCFTTTGSSSASPEINFADISPSFTEGGGMGHLQLILSTPAIEPFSVPVNITGGSASIGTDHTAPASSLITFYPGQTSAWFSFGITADYTDESDETILFRLGSPSSLSVDVGPDDVANVVIQDDEEAPNVVGDPASDFARVGDDVSFIVSALGSNLTYQWKKNGANLKNSATILGANSSTLTLRGVSLSSAGNYQCEVRNVLSTDLSASAELFVIDPASKNYVLPTGSNVTLSVKTAGPLGSSISFTWKRDGSPVFALSGTFPITGVTTGDVGDYICEVNKTGSPGLSSTSNTFSIRVPTAAPELIPIPGGALPAAVVGVPYSYAIQFDTSRPKAPASFKITGLPKGLSVNSSGLISGVPTTVTTTPALISITATNPFDTSVPLNVSLSVLPMPMGILGDYVSLASPDTSNVNLGARIDLSVTNSGGYTAKYTSGAVSFSTSGKVQIATNSTTVTSAAITAVFTKRQPALTVVANLTAAADAVSGTVNDPLASPVAHQGFRNRWSIAQPPIDYKDVQPYTFGLHLPSNALGQQAFPQGQGYGSFVIDDKASPVISGRTADGIAYTTATIMGPNGELPLHIPFTGRIGSLHGLVDITPAIGVPADNLVDGPLLWTKPAAPASSPDQVYRAGFAIAGVMLSGGRYSAPVPGTVVMDLTNTTDNARVELSEGGLIPGEAPDVIVSITNPSATGTSQLVTSPPAGSAENPNGLKLKVDSTKASFTGDFVIPGSLTSLNRKVTYQGVFVRRGVAGFSTAGFFLLPQVPQPGQSVTTSPVLSGDVNILPNP